jgi:GMP synthase (glutamine-hydrolysing)
MKKTKKDLHILYIQIRPDEETRKEEFDEFIRFSGLEKDQFTYHNVFDTPEFDETIIEGHDAIFVGGSSDATVLEPEKYPFIVGIKTVFKYALEQNIPVFASCFGFEVAVETFGGKVIMDRENMEMGMYPIQLTDAAKTDRLFHDMTKGCYVVSGHQERAHQLPDEAILLASSKLCPFHAFRMKNTNFYAFQFHPEIDMDDLIARLRRYKNKSYFDDHDHVERLIEDCKPVPESNGLLGKFVDRVLLT